MSKTMLNKMTLQTEGETHVVVTRRFAASPEAVYRAHTDPKLIQRWLLGPEGWVPTQHYEEAVALCKQMKEEALTEARSEGEHAEIMTHWPWDDMDEGKYM